MSEIIPAILPKSENDLREKLDSLPGEISFFHSDVLEEDIWIDRIKQNFEAHLMVRYPEKIINTWIKRGAKRIIVHESSPEIVKYKSEVEIGLEIEIMVLKMTLLFRSVKPVIYIAICGLTSYLIIMAD